MSDEEPVSPTTADDFGARYYSSTIGRFITPDWSERPEGVPYATLANPQTLNLYSYVKNDPITESDPDGHEGEGPANHTGEPGGICEGPSCTDPKAVQARQLEKAPEQNKQTVVFGEPERTIQQKPGAAASRDVYYKSGKMDKDGNISDIDRKSTLTLHEKLDPNSKTKANICDKPCSGPNSGGQFVDLQFVPAGGSFRVLRDWKVGSESVKVFDPETHKAFRYEVNINDANSKTPIKTQYTDSPPF